MGLLELLLDKNLPQNRYGLLSPGNIDIFKRPTKPNKDGSISTVRSLGFAPDGVETLIPTIGPQGEDWTPQQAMQYAMLTGKNLGTFMDWRGSDKYAQALHEQQDALYSNRKPVKLKMTGLLGLLQDQQK